MKNRKIIRYGIFSLLIGLIIFSISSCNAVRKKRMLENFKYESFRDSLIANDTTTIPDTVNLFDEELFTPGVDSLDSLLVKIDTIWKRDAVLMEYLDSVQRGIEKGAGFSEMEKAIIKENMIALDSFLVNQDNPDTVECKGKDCILYVEIDKSKQLLYLYILGELKDTFKVSTGLKGKYETPNLNQRPRGPIFTKYTSRKFPGGNYQGLGNMPYAVFVRGGYAIHGTTPGNFSKLGTRASHGCIRLHPDNAKVFNALIKVVGLQQTWVTLKDSLP